MSLPQLSQEDIDRGITNPFFSKLNKIVEVVVKNEDYDYFCKLAEINQEKPEYLMRRILRMAAQEMRESDDE